ncbi:4a-hydroxytetrahydrobiopterin dehydratase [Bacteroidia bacterium]|jgi:4a-hydroxytetrahydrobiopterin dehydratase|nr:4a-hydroxytetrahydrobiopterin dehydratase [Bacteroidia bacterium]MDC0561888.1 4a-hydroxytetrahydrobiopterin dehydratase [Bacteroidia bacterium]MDC3407280.1 4a-hydroxytetrahydrobiopterin dehydratase [Bacteroidia bacterium]
MKKLSITEIEDSLKRIHSEWVLMNEVIQRKFVFDDFIEAFSFMTSVAIIAEKQNHHPNWENVYNQVIVNLSTHDADGITEKDFKLAQKMDQLFDS